MAQIINVGGKNLLAGMHWLDPESVKSNIQQVPAFLSKFVKPKNSAAGPITERALVAAKKASFAAGATRNAWGYLTAFENRAMRKVSRFDKVYSLAEMFSAVPDLAVCSILIAQIPGEEEYAMCTSINGHPAPGDFDVVVPKSEVEKTLLSWDSQLRAVTTSDPALYGTWTGVTHSLTLEKLTLTAAAVRPVRSVATDKRQIAVLGLVVGGTVVGYLAWQDHKQEQSIIEKQIRDRQQDAASVYQRALDAQWPAQPWGSMARVRALQQHVRTVREYVGGFKISSSVTCEVLTGACKFSYKKDGDSAATFQDFIDDIEGQFVPTSFGQDGKTVEVSMTVKGLPASSPPRMDLLVDESQSPLLFWPLIQKLVPTQKVSGGLQTDYKVFPQGLSINEAAVPILIRSVGVTVTYPLWDLVQIPSAKGVFANAISWRTLTVGNGVVTLAGDMYAKKANR
ncbi:MAG: hypothetical protein K2X55_07390 [Burkholderiaceae bacterium]|nr:hypothetical protein [Burkholderiaceae bacterium]